MEHQSRKERITSQLWAQEQSRLHQKTAVHRSLCSCGSTPHIVGRGRSPVVKIKA